MHIVLKVFHIPRSTYYDWLRWHPKSRNRRRIKLKELVQVLWQRRKFYGYVRIAKRIRKLLKCRLRTCLVSFKNYLQEGQYNHLKTAVKGTFTVFPKSPTFV